jgi:2-polyprenyl-3-methyl-5-hydroxy-6-metoxy-1,4-benzoquinol methylase
MPFKLQYEFRPVASCNMCGSTGFKLLGLRLNGSQGLNPRRAEGIAVPVKQCRSCGLIFADPQPVPNDLTDHYGLPPEDYWADPDHWTWTPAYFATEIAEAKRLLDFQPGMKALDIGVGLGKAMRSLNHAGFDSWGIEPIPMFRDKAIEKMDLNPDRVTLAAAENAIFDDGSFDFITFGAVLEHLYDPAFALERAMNWLKPGGIIQAEVPSAGYLMSKLLNLYFRLRGTNYVTHLSPMHPPFHLYEFTPRSFARFNPVHHRHEVCSIRHVPRLLHPPLRWLMDKTNRGMQLTVYLRRPAASP